MPGSRFLIAEILIRHGRAEWRTPLKHRMTGLDCEAGARREDTWEKRREEAPAYSLPESLQVMQMVSRITEPTSRMAMTVMKPYTHRGIESVTSRTA